MTETIIQLGTDDVWRALGATDPVAAVAEDLIGRTLGREHDARAPGRLVPWVGGREPDTVAFENSAGAVTCVAPASSLRMARAAVLSVLAARELLVPGGLTVAIVGTSWPVQPQLAAITRHVPDISHVAVWLADMPGSAKLSPEVLDQLELSGIRLSVASSLTEALFGANLVIVTGDGTGRDDFDQLRFGQFARGTVLVNASGNDLPAELVDQIEDVYVDDLGLVADNRHRYAAARHLAEPGGGTRIVSDLGLLLAGRARSTRHAGSCVLVELLGAAELSAEFAYRICRTARLAGLGTPITGGPA